MKIDFDAVVPKFDAILARGLCEGVGDRDGQMCIEAAICAVLDLPHGDQPTCVHPAVRAYKIRLNDAGWSSPTARAAGLRRLGILQMGTDTGFDASAFAEQLAIRTVRDLLSDLLERMGATRYAAHIAACRAVTTKGEARAAARAAADAAYAYAAYAYAAAAYGAAADAAAADAYAADAADAAAADADAAAVAVAAARMRSRPTADYYLLMSARLAEDILMEMDTPGAQWLKRVEAA